MLYNKLSQKYGKREFYAKIEPDNYMSQFLFEKLRAIPVGLAKDFQILEYYFTVPTSSNADLCLLSQKLRVTARHED